MKKIIIAAILPLLAACIHHSYPVPDAKSTAMIGGDGIIFRAYNGIELTDAQTNGEIVHVPLGVGVFLVDVGAYDPRGHGGYIGYSSQNRIFSYDFDCPGDWDAETGCLYLVKFVISSKDEWGVNIYKLDLTKGLYQGHSSTIESAFLPFQK